MLRQFFTYFSQGRPFGYTIADKVVFQKVQKAVGLERCRNWSGAAPISKDILEYLGSVGLNVMELFGMSECTGQC